jgi:hypothetical protein
VRGLLGFLGSEEGLSPINFDFQVSILKGFDTICSVRLVLNLMGISRYSAQCEMNLSRQVLIDITLAIFSKLSAQKMFSFLFNMLDKSRTRYNYSLVYMKKPLIAVQKNAICFFILNLGFLIPFLTTKTLY